MTAIELTSPRVIAIEDRARKFSLTLKRIDRRMWFRYFDGIVNVSETQNGERIDRFDSTAARLELVHAALVDAAGYTTLNGAPVPETEGWQQLIPLAHRLAAGEQLVNVERGTLPDEESFVLGFETVVLNAIWADDSGIMRRYSGLRHRFRTPSAEHQARLSRAASRSIIVGGTRRGTTRWLGAQATLAELYDELIESVEGYTVNHIDLGCRGEVVDAMDTYHKVAATDALFSPAQVVEPVTAEVK